MLDDDDRGPEFLLHLVDEAHGLVARGRVQVGQGFVKEQDRGLVNQDPSQGHPLLLSARQALGSLLEQIAQIQLLGPAVYHLLHFVLGHAVIFQGKSDVFPDRQADKLGIRILENG